MQYTNEAIKNRRKRQIKIKKFFTIIVYIILIPLLVYNISLIFQAITNPNKTPSFFGIKTYIIVSGSMQPELDIKDIVVVKEVTEDELKKGDIISFRAGQTVITHRIIDIVNEDGITKYKTKGDANNSEDNNKITINQIEGKVITSVSFLGNIVLMLQDKVIIISIVLIFYAYFVRSDKIKKKKENRRIKRLEYEKGKMENEKK